MAFVPMVSSSPPPMIPDDIEDIEDDDEFVLQHTSQDEDEDSSSYDLTGLSEKIHSIPKEAIQVAPKEVALPQNGLINEIPPDGILLNSNEEVSAFETNVMNIENDRLDDMPEENGEFGDFENTTIIESFEVKSENIDLKYEHSNPDLEKNKDDKLEECEDIDDTSENKVDTLQNDIKVLNQEVIKNHCLHESDTDDDEFGDFDSVNRVNNLVDEKDSDDNDDFGDFEDMPKVPPLTLDEDLEESDDKDDEDEFGDFTTDQDVKPETTSFASAAGWASLNSSPRGKLDQILIGLQLKLATVISSLYLSLESPDEVTDRIQPLDFDREDCEDHIWHLIHNIQSTPALNQKWKDTEGRTRLLTFLKIDPRNANQHEFLVSKPIKSSNPSNVPAFASGLGTTLEPLKAGKNEPKKEVEEPLKIPNALNDTPVIHPPPPEILKPTFGASLLPNEEDFKGITTVTSKNNVKPTKTRSSAAQTIIDSFPLLDFMQSPILSLEAVKKS